jgi:hypothetical protein
MMSKSLSPFLERVRGWRIVLATPSFGVAGAGLAQSLHEDDLLLSQDGGENL